MRDFRKKKSSTVKVNVIPILDAVFIFIFFLLMSAQFVDVYEIGSDAPAVSIVENDSEKDPLNLTLKISKNSISVLTGINSSLVKKISIVNIDEGTKELRSTLAKIKSENISESSIIFRPSQDVPYRKLVKIMDAVKRLDVNALPIATTTKQGNTEKTKELFNQIIFETM